MADQVPLRETSASVVTGDAGLSLDLDGVDLTIHWPGAGYCPRAGDTVRVLIVGNRAMVLHAISEFPRPATGTTSGAATGGVVPVTGSDGRSYSCRYIGTAPSIGTLVRLDWTTTEPWIWPQAAAVVPPAPDPDPAPPTPAPPPPAPQSGTSVITAIDSGSWQSTGWGFQGTKVIQWRYPGSPENRGAWFYGNAPSGIAGATITRAQIRLGARLRMGSWSAAVGLNLQRHTAPTKPEGDVSRVGAVHVVTLAPSAGPQWVDIPVSMAQDIVNGGGGIAISGSPYAGVAGVGDDRESGQLRLDWTR